MRTRRLVAALLILGLPAASAGAADRLVPLVAGWESYFKVEWEAGERQGRAVVRGHVLNDWGHPAMRIRLLVEGLDASGQVVTQQVAWLGAALTPGMRAYFEVPVRQRVASHRVSIFAFDWMQTAGGQR